MPAALGTFFSRRSGRNPSKSWSAAALLAACPIAPPIFDCQISLGTRPNNPGVRMRTYGSLTEGENQGAACFYGSRDPTIMFGILQNTSSTHSTTRYAPRPRFLL